MDAPAESASGSSNSAEVTSSFQKRPAYRYLRNADLLPMYAEVSDKPLDDIIVKVRLFNPTGIGTWWVAAYEPDTMVAWGVAELHCAEVGSFSMAELVIFRGRFGLPIERDLHFSPTSVAAVLNGSR